MKGPAGFGKIMNIMMNLILSVVIGLVVMSLLQKAGLAVLTPLTLFTSCVTTFVTGYTIADLVPTLSWANAISRALHAGKAASYVISCVIMGVVLGALICLVSGYIMNMSAGGWAAVTSFWSSFIVLIMCVATGVVLIIFAPVTKMAVAISGFDPAGAQDTPPARG